MNSTGVTLTSLVPDAVIANPATAPGQVSSIAPDGATSTDQLSDLLAPA